MFKFGQSPVYNIPLPPSAIDPSSPLMRGGRLPQYGHTVNGIPPQYSQVPTGIAQTTKNPAVNSILSAIVPGVGKKLGINVVPSTPIPENMSPAQAGEALAFTAPMYAQHMKRQQGRAANLASQAISNTVDLGMLRKINPQLSRKELQAKINAMMSGPAGAMMMSVAPKDSPIHVMMNPETQLAKLNYYMRRNRGVPKRAQAQEQNPLDFKKTIQTATSVMNSKLRKLKTPGVPGTKDSLNKTNKITE